jgi:RNA polymerase-associated protein LEO1
MSYEEDNESGSDHDFGDLFGSEDEASDIDDGRSQSSAGSPMASTQPLSAKSPPAPQQQNKSNDLDNLFGSDDESESEEEQQPRQTLKQRR